MDLHQCLDPMIFGPGIYKKTLDATTQIFIAVNYLKLMSEKYVHFKTRQKHVARKFTTAEVTKSMKFENFFGVSQRYKQKFERN